MNPQVEQPKKGLPCHLYISYTCDWTCSVAAVTYIDIQKAIHWLSFLRVLSNTTGSAKFMATHILTWFSNKNEEN